MEDISKNPYVEVEITGMLVTPEGTTEDEVLDSFIEWVESKEYQFGGGVKYWVEPLELKDLHKNKDHIKQLFNAGFGFGMVDPNEYISVSDRSTIIILGNQILIIDHLTGHFKFKYSNQIENIEYNPFKVVSLLNRLGYDF